MPWLIPMALTENIRHIGVGLFCLPKSEGPRNLLLRWKEDIAPHLSIFITAELGLQGNKKNLNHEKILCNAIMRHRRSIINECQCKKMENVY